MYEQLISELEENEIDLIEIPLKGALKGLYSDNTIAINSNIVTIKEKTCVLAEELGHYHTSCGDILDQSKVENRKQERRARAWGYERLVGIVNLINAFKLGIKNRYELAEYLDVTEEYIEEALKYYQQKHGLYYQIDNYVVYFNPFSVLEMWE